jgi:hypothetical protein
MTQIPSFLEIAGNRRSIDSGGVFDDNALHIGEVKEIVYPSDERSLSKKFREYTVFVQRRANGTYVNQVYENCLLASQFGTPGDCLRYTLRADPQVKSGVDSTFTGPGLGARVLIQCINGEMHNAVIVGALQNADDTSEQKAEKDKRGHHLEWEFNGVNIAIEDDGSLHLFVKGKTDASGKVQNENGTRITIAADGTCTISTPKAKFKVGEGADEAMVLGNQLVTLLRKLIQAIMAITVVSAVGTSTPPVNAPAFAQLMQTLDDILSQFAFVKKEA